jgi:superfamily I DNA/RNA helicase
MLILAPSVKNVMRSNSNNPLSVLVYLLTQHHILTEVKSSLDETSSLDASKGKLLITTYHQSKGIERKVVFVYGFDAKSLDFKQQKSKSKEAHIGSVIQTAHTCGNEYYVACTRATEQLIVVAEERKGGHLPFLDLTALDVMRDENTVKFVNTYPEKRKHLYRETKGGLFGVNILTVLLNNADICSHNL